MTDNESPDLAVLCADLAEELDEVTSTTDGDVASYARGGAVFARVTSARLEVRLPLDIAAVIARGQDASLDPDDRGWVRFSPTSGQRWVADQAKAWFENAWRHASDN